MATETVLSKLDEEVMDVLNELYDAIKHLDADQFTEMLDRSENTSWIDVNGWYKISWQSIHDAIKEHFKHFTNVETIKFERKQLVPLAKDIVFYGGIFSWSGIFDGQPKTGSQSGAYIFVRKDGGWKIAHILATTR
jgi:hypothetical protein